jgi:hypothetical protein
MMEAQIVDGLGHLCIERRIAGKAENVVVAVIFRPLHRFDATVMTVATPHDAGVRPMSPQALRHVLDDGPHLRALRGARRTQDGGDRRAARHVIDVHRRKAALVVMCVQNASCWPPCAAQNVSSMSRTSSLPGFTVVPN